MHSAESEGKFYAWKVKSKEGGESIFMNEREEKFIACFRLAFCLDYARVRLRVRSLLFVGLLDVFLR